MNNFKFIGGIIFMRIVIDTNIWISAIVTEGRISKWLDNVCQNKDIIIILSTSILAEIKATLQNNNRNRIKKKKRRCFTEEHRKKFEAILKKTTFEIIETKPINALDIYIRDEDDIHIIETAIEGHADVIVSGDKDFEEVKTSLFKIMKPSEFC